MPGYRVSSSRCFTCSYLIEHRCGQQILIDFGLKVVLGAMASLAAAAAIAKARQLPIGARIQANLGDGAAGRIEEDAVAAAAQRLGDDCLNETAQTRLRYVRQLFIVDVVVVAVAAIVIVVAIDNGWQICKQANWSRKHLGD